MKYVRQCVDCSYVWIDTSTRRCPHCKGVGKIVGQKVSVD